MNLDVLLTYQDVITATGTGTRHLLLGNGFSIACDPVFSYRSLYDAAVENGISERAQNLFGRLGTNNFEAVMRLLADGEWLCQIYQADEEIVEEIRNDLRLVKEALISVVADSHPDSQNAIDENRRRSAADFISEYDNVFSLNYDLLPVWMNMFAGERPPFEDGFRADAEDPEDVALLFCEPPGRRKGMFFLHGALHIYVSRRGIRKHSWLRSAEPLTQLVRAGLTENKFPLFVAEGTAENKRYQILNNGYLSYCFGKFGRIQNPLITFGWSFGDSDRHLVDAIADNEKLRILYVGVRGDIRGERNAAIVRNLEYIETRRSQARWYNPSRNSIDIKFYSSETANPWSS